jgi:hypothetical protein
MKAVARPTPSPSLPAAAGLWSSRNRARRRERGDSPARSSSAASRSAWPAPLLGRVLADAGSWLDYAELGDYLLRLGLSWLFLTFLSFLAFSSVVTSLSTFFLSDDLRLLLAAPVAAAAVPRALRAHGRPGVVDGRGLHGARAGRRRPGALRATVVLRRRRCSRSCRSC